MGKRLLVMHPLAESPRITDDYNSLCAFWFLTSRNASKSKIICRKGVAKHTVIACVGCHPIKQQLPTERKGLEYRGCDPAGHLDEVLPICCGQIFELWRAGCQRV